jgi:uncharacterized Fe-S cluster-containing radical SAM superfamily protein
MMPCSVDRRHSGPNGGRGRANSGVGARPRRRRVGVPPKLYANLSTNGPRRASTPSLFTRPPKPDDFRLGSWVDVPLEGNMTEQDLQGRRLADLAPGDLVRSCKYIEMGSCFALEGIRSCVHGTIQSRVLVTAEEIRTGAVTYDLVVQRRKSLFAALNGLADGHGPTDPCATCAHLKQVKYKDVNFEYVGGEPLPAGLNIQHYTECNQRCSYCDYAQKDRMFKVQYNMLDYLDLFRKVGKLRGNNWVDFSGGEPAIFPEFPTILRYLLDNKMGTVVVFSNALRFSQTIYDALKENRIILVTSLDTGIASSYKKLRGGNFFPKVIRNLIRYRNSGTKQLWLKFIVTDLNRTEDDLWSFVLAMLALRPDRLLICPDFPYTAPEVPAETTKFVARLWYILEKLTGITPLDYVSEFGDPLWLKYHASLKQALDEVYQKKPLGDECKIEKLAFPPPAFAPSPLHRRVIAAKRRVWGSDLRKRILPVGSAGEARARQAWRRTFGRLFSE